MCKPNCKVDPNSPLQEDNDMEINDDDFDANQSHLSTENETLESNPVSDSNTEDVIIKALGQQEATKPKNLSVAM